MRSEDQRSVLVVDDDVALGKVLTSLLIQAGLAASHASSAEQALRAMSDGGIDLVVTDLRMPGMDGMALLRELKRIAPEVPVVMLTAHGSVPVAVEAMRQGAADFLTKPFDREEVLFTVRKALDVTERAAASPPEPRAERALLGGSDPMREVEALVARAARTVANVLVRGESGTGKEIVARTIHAHGHRAGGPFVAVNCAALPEQLFESELFGYERGAFTGAVSRRPGRVELARGGTLFLDEIGDVPPSAQAKLLRLLQEKEYQPLGGTRTEKADVRFVAATHRDLESMITSGAFREDLYFRLNVIPIWLPPLRERPGDVAELAVRFGESLGAQNGRTALQWSRKALDRLQAYAWPGNVRELMCVVERLIVFSDTDVLEEADVARELERIRAPGLEARADRGSESQAPESAPEAESQGLVARRQQAEREAVLDALRRAGQNRTTAARLLGVSRRTLYKRLSGLGIVT
jgi:DNA-binding NtrC family response regulator